MELFRRSWDYNGTLRFYCRLLYNTTHGYIHPHLRVPRHRYPYPQAQVSIPTSVGMGTYAEHIMLQIVGVNHCDSSTTSARVNSSSDEALIEQENFTNVSVIAEDVALVGERVGDCDK